jgi:phosphatidylglycerophosphate synthase
MKLSPPKQITFWVSVVIALVAVVASFVAIPFLSPFAFWIAILAFVLLALANLLDGL